MFSATGWRITTAHIEPLQLVRYKPTERFGPHHDYHLTGKSSVQGEQASETLAAKTASASCATHLPRFDANDG